MLVKTGLYGRAGHMWASTYRLLVQKDSRICIKIVNGPPRPYESYQEVTVSSVSLVEGNLRVDATKERLIFHENSIFFFSEDMTLPEDLSNSRGAWDHTSDDFKVSEDIESCLAASGIYVKTTRERYIPGRVQGSATGILTAENPESQINVRTGPGLSFDSPSYGLVGDEVTIDYSQWSTDSREWSEPTVFSRNQSQPDPVGGLWYRVKFAGSGVQGWIRSDFVQRPDAKYPGESFSPNWK